MDNNYVVDLHLLMSYSKYDENKLFIFKFVSASSNTYGIETIRKILTCLSASANEALHGENDEGGLMDMEHLDFTYKNHSFADNTESGDWYVNALAQGIIALGKKDGYTIDLVDVSDFKGYIDGILTIKQEW